MPQWHNKDQANNSVNYGAVLVESGSGKSNRAANNTALYINTTPEAFEHDMSAAIGQFGVSVNQAQNTTGEGTKITHPGWLLRKEFMGPVANTTIGGGSGYTNGGVIVFSGTGETNGYGVLTTNSTGGVTAVTITVSGLFTNVGSVTVSNPNGAISVNSTFSVANAGAGYHTGDIITFSNGTVNAIGTIGANATSNVANVTITNAGAGFTSNTNTVQTILCANGSPTGNGLISITSTSNGLGYSNTDTIVASNATLNAVFSITTNSIGGITANALVNCGSGFTGPTNTVITIVSNNEVATGNGLLSVTVGTGQTNSPSWTNGDVVTFSNATVNATGNIQTNSTGYISSIVVTAVGRGFTGASNTVQTFANSTGGTTGIGNTATANLTPVFAAAATFTLTFDKANFSPTIDSGTSANVTVTLGGRAGRIQYETLVAMGTIVANTSTGNQQIFPYS